MTGSAVLYLSYDGMSDPLGQSQVLPYLAGLTRRGHRITLVSFEKRERSATEMEAARQACAAAGVEWHPLRYHKWPPILSSVYDLAMMRRAAVLLHKRHRFDWVHCRSYLPALVGLAMKQRHGARFLFDMRGFWADERVEGGLWDLGRKAYRAVFDYFKRKEAELLAAADHVVSLTEEARREMLSRPERTENSPPITVIPCCVDFDTFTPATSARREEARRLLGIAPDRRVAAYLGSIGSWYMLAEMLDCFNVQLDRDPDALFLIVTKEPAAPIVEAARQKGIPESALLVRSASRDEVPRFVATADYGLFFIRPTYSKKASCPTKLGEYLALEIPVLTNGGVGDVARVIEETGAGVLVEGFEEAAYHDALDRFQRIGTGRAQWRERARSWFDLEEGVARYDAIYRGSTEPSPK